MAAGRVRTPVTEFCIVGGGIAGLSIAYQLSASSSVVLLEREPRLGTQTTGRSAALYSELPMAGTVRGLSRLSRPFFISPPAEFGTMPLHAPLGCILTARAADLGQLEAYAADDGRLQWLDADALRARVPILRVQPDGIVAGLLESGAFRIDVAALVEDYRRGARARGAEIRSGSEVYGLSRAGECWSIDTGAGGPLRADVIVNAAGAWGDAVAALAGAAPLGLMPLRRTIIVFDPPPSLDCRAWPAVGGVDGSYYLLPDAGRLMGSAADEVPSPPCDAQPDELDVALAAQRIEDVTSMTIARIRNRWAGLRTFAPDRLPVVGYDPAVVGFFWFVGQGGFGIQTAPALARAAAALALDQPLPDDCVHAGITGQALSPARFAGG
jgi:D-arginine dehydrogenase